MRGIGFSADATTRSLMLWPRVARKGVASDAGATFATLAVDDAKVVSGYSAIELPGKESRTFAAFYRT